MKQRKIWLSIEDDVFNQTDISHDDFLKELGETLLHNMDDPANVNNSLVLRIRADGYLEATYYRDPNYE